MEVRLRSQRSSEVCPDDERCQNMKQQKCRTRSPRRRKTSDKLTGKYANGIPEQERRAIENRSRDCHDKKYEPGISPLTPDQTLVTTPPTTCSHVARTCKQHVTNSARPPLNELIEYAQSRHRVAKSHTLHSRRSGNKTHDLSPLPNLVQACLGLEPAGRTSVRR